MTITAESLDMTRLALEVAVDQLTRPGSERVPTEDPERPWRYAATPSLLDQLAEARRARTGGGTSGVSGPRPPVWIDALSLLQEIDLHVRPHFSRQGRAGKVRAWSAAMHAVTDVDALEEVTRVAEEWVRRVRVLLDPTPFVELPGHCPTCGRAKVSAEDDEAEIVHRHALRAVEADEMTGMPSAWCGACADRFEGEALWLLADHLDRQTAVEHLAVE